MLPLHSRFGIVLALLLATAGCARWTTPKFDLRGLRDPRAIDIDNRLSAPPATVGPVDSE